MRFLLLIVFIAISNTAMSQLLSEDSVQSLLSGSNNKEWMDPAWQANKHNRCRAGASYVFYKNGSIEKKQCANGAIVKTTLAWHVERRGSDNILVIGTDSYQIRPKLNDSSKVSIRILVAGKVPDDNKTELTYKKS